MSHENIGEETEKTINENLKSQRNMSNEAKLAVLPVCNNKSHLAGGKRSKDRKHVRNNKQKRDNARHSLQVYLTATYL
jgi:hypothetical protein